MRFQRGFEFTTGRARARADRRQLGVDDSRAANRQRASCSLQTRADVGGGRVRQAELAGSRRAVRRPGTIIWHLRARSCGCRRRTKRPCESMNVSRTNQESRNNARPPAPAIDVDDGNRPLDVGRCQTTQRPPPRPCAQQCVVGTVSARCVETRSHRTVCTVARHWQTHSGCRRRAVRWLGSRHRLRNVVESHFRRLSVRCEWQRRRARDSRGARSRVGPWSW